MGKLAHVVVLDDEQYVLNSLQRMLRNEPFGIFLTTNHQEALEEVKKENVKVVMSDQKMPEISGVDLLNKVKIINPHIIRILFTGHADIQAAEDAINKGEVYQFINKPWNDEDLKAVIRQAIEKFDLEQANRELTIQIAKQNEELVVLNTKLKNMYEAQKNFSSTVSHELRTPLASIKTAIDVVMSETSGKLTNDQKNFLRKAKTNVDRLNRLINDVLSLSKLESGKTELNLQPADINSVINEVVEIQRSVAEKEGLYLKTQLSDNMPKVKFNTDKINQVLNNLISNAIKFTSEGGIVVSSLVNQKENHLVVSVKDTGCGIKDEDKSKLFQKFQQLDDPVKNQTGGTGLGLAICKEIINQHGGKIWVESEFGKGAVFYFLLTIKERRQE